MNKEKLFPQPCQVCGGDGQGLIERDGLRITQRFAACDRCAGLEGYRELRRSTMNEFRVRHGLVYRG